MLFYYYLLLLFIITFLVFILIYFYYHCWVGVITEQRQNDTMRQKKNQPVKICLRAKVSPCKSNPSCNSIFLQFYTLVQKCLLLLLLFLNLWLVFFRYQACLFYFKNEKENLCFIFYFSIEVILISKSKVLSLETAINKIVFIEIVNKIWAY